jgi:hypothetical protein
MFRANELASAGIEPATIGAGSEKRKYAPSFGLRTLDAAALRPNDRLANGEANANRSTFDAEKSFRKYAPRCGRRC